QFASSLRLSNKIYAEEVADEVEMESEKTDDDSDEEGDVTEMEQENTNPMELLGEMTCKLSKSQERELRKLRKMDYSWISAF
uniref:Uncharacterized protein n=1 Tax=Strigops habroptila TaxID=2489341 RepID=A0A672UFF8_STRHB